MLTQERLHELFGYDADSGRLVRIKFEKPGEKIITYGISRQGYFIRWVDDVCYLEHQLVYLWHTGCFVQEIDHVNRNKTDNRFPNLRACDRTLNNANQNLRVNNKSGYRGVSWSKPMRKWWAQITVRKVHHNLGYHDTPEQAALRYNEAARHYFGEFAYINEVCHVDT